MHDTDTISLVFLIIAVIILSASIIGYPLWMVIHHILCKKLDSILFREPYFQKSEPVNYLCWPLSCIRSLNYIGLLAAPRISKRSRFRGFDEPLPVGCALEVACKVQFSLMLVLAVMFFGFFGFGGAVILFDL